MSRPKLKDDKQRLSHSIIIRVNEATFQRLEKLAENSSYRTVAEVARKILSNEKLNVFHKDATMNGPMEELALIRKELKAIGININQQTHHFHISAHANERAYYVQQTATLYKQVDGKVDSLLILVGKLAEKWLQK
jgi:hypothetical protein